jgi:hypothetical protein
VVGEALLCLGVQIEVTATWANLVTINIQESGCTFGLNKIGTSVNLIVD